MVKEIRVVKALIRYKDKYLLLKKTEDMFFPENIGKWECVGGIIEEGETSQQTIIEEVKGETNLKFRIIKKLPTIRMTDENYDSNCDVYLLEADTDKVTLSSEHSDYSWVKPEDVKNLDLVLYASLLLEYFNNPEKYL